MNSTYWKPNDINSSYKLMAYLSNQTPSLQPSVYHTAQPVAGFPSLVPVDSSQVNLPRPLNQESRISELSDEQSHELRDESETPLDQGADEVPSFTPEKTARGRKAVSGTRRAAQNRNAQKAFRERRHKYVKDLEATAAEVNELKNSVEKLEQENHLLREYTRALERRLMHYNPNEVFRELGSS